MKKTWLIALVLMIPALIVFPKGNDDDSDSTSALEGYSQAGDEDMSFDFQWKIEGDLIHIHMAAPTTGWVSVGFDPSNKMAGADILIGYVADGEAFLRDDYGTGAVKHGPDTGEGGEENFTNLTGSESDGITVIQFTIPLDSGDAYDKKLTPGGTHKVIYAYGPNGKDDFGSYHSRSRGSFEVTL